MISTRGRYAIRLMIDLAKNGSSDSSIPLKDIAARQELSRKYLEIIAGDLAAGGLIAGSSGKHGGYRLCRNPEEYTIGEILELMEGTLCPVACMADKSYVCSRREICETLPLWEEFDRLVRDFFYGKRLSDLL